MRNFAFGASGLRKNGLERTGQSSVPVCRLQSSSVSFACDRKRPYRSKKQAAGAACRVMAGPGNPPKLYTYRCKKCGKWHLTKMPPQETSATTPIRPRASSDQAPNVLNPAHPDHPVLSPRQIELKRLISEAREMQGRWGGLAALLDRIERNDNLEGIGGEVEAMAAAHNAAVDRKEETVQVIEKLFILIHYQAASPRLRSSVFGPSKP